MKVLIFLSSVVLYFGQNLFAVEQIQIPIYKFLRDDNRNVVIEQTLNLMWQDDESVVKVTKNWDEAKEYCKQSTYLGFYNWRLPTVEELLLLIDEGRSAPAINSQFKNVFHNRYWTNSNVNSYSTGNAEGDSLRESNEAHMKIINQINGKENIKIQQAWAIGFTTGMESSGDKSENFHVRCVRNNQ